MTSQDDCIVDESEEDGSTFEMIPPVITVTSPGGYKNPRQCHTPPLKRRRSVTKHSPSPSNRKVNSNSNSNSNTISERESPRRRRRSPQQWSEAKLTTIAFSIAVLMLGTTAFFLFGRVSSRNQIEELRLEFKGELDSLRLEVEHELGVHLLATAAVQTAANDRVIELEAETPIETESNGRNSEIINESDGIDQVLFTMESETSIDKNNWYRLQGDWLLQPIGIVSSLGWSIRDKMLRQLQTMYVATITSDWTKNTILRQAQGIHVANIVSWDWTPNKIQRQLQSINLAATLDSMDWITRSTILHRAIEFANHVYFLEVCAWSTALLLLLYNCCRCCWGPNTDRYRNRDCGTTNNAHDSSNLVLDEKGSDECSKTSSHSDADLLPEERIEDVIMEHMFDESMATAGNLDANVNRRPVVVSRIYIGGNQTNSIHRGTISNDERRRRARISAREFAARDKQRLAAAGAGGASRASNAASVSQAPREVISKEERRRRARINAREFAARDKQSLTGGGRASRASYASASSSSTGVGINGNAKPKSPPCHVLPPPWISKSTRLKRARANAKLYADQDKQRLQKAAADGPWKK